MLASDDETIPLRFRELLALNPLVPAAILWVIGLITGHVAQWDILFYIRMTCGFLLAYGVTEILSRYRFFSLCRSNSACSGHYQLWRRNLYPLFSLC